MIPQRNNKSSDQRTRNRAQRTRNRTRSTRNRAWSAGVTPHAQAPVPSPVPIAEVGTAVRAASGQVGIIRDALEVDGNLAYIVEFYAPATGDAWQCIPARALKGVWL